jgi:phage gp37-like protein
MTKDSSPLPSITEQAEATYKAIKKVRHLYAEQQVSNVLAMRNSLNIKPLLTLLLQSDI